MDNKTTRSAHANSVPWPATLGAAVVALIMATNAGADDDYSPTIRHAYPDTVYWGDTHVHTYLSADAFGMGTRTTPDDAYRFAKGEEVTATGGERVRMRRPLDFLLIADHAENLGVLARLVGGDERLSTEDGQSFAALFAQAPALADVLNADSLDAFNALSKTLMEGKAAWNGDYRIDVAFKGEVWHAVIDAAERHNDPGTFTTFAGYEYSSNPPMLHRNVLFAGDPESTRQTLPFSKYDSANPEDLWADLAEYEARTGSAVIAIPHNSNLSRGAMFSPRTHGEGPMTAAYASVRAAREPVVEVTQIKGDSETHPQVSPDDPFADFETWGGGAKDGTSDASVAASYVRPALKRGLGLQAEVGVNPFKFGMIGSTDSHNGLATADDADFWGKHASNEPSPYRALTGAIFTASGYAAVWAEANTRQALFDAFKRREVYATTGPRIVLRFFGGWDYTDADAARPDFTAIGYRNGVPMGGDLTAAESGKTPRLLIRAVKDPDGANLDRVQVVKGWRDRKGELYERVYDVAWSGNRLVKNGVLEDLESTVDLATATYLNSVGAAELAVTWTDPDFDAGEAAFYYVRAIEIPTPRWTAYDAAFYGIDVLPETVPLVTRERAYSSPIWYTP